MENKLALLYIFFCVISILILVNKRVNYLSIFAISYLLFTSPCVLGVTWISYNSNIIKISNKTYYVIFAQFVILIFALFIDKIKGKKIRQLYNNSEQIKKNDSSVIFLSQNNDSLFYFFAFISICFFVYELFFNIGLNEIAKGKNVYMQEASGLLNFSLYLAYSSFAYSLHMEKKWMLILSSSVILGFLFLGSRTYATVAVVYFVVFFGSRIRKKITSNKKLLFGGAIGFYMMLLYKTIYTDVNTFRFDSVISKLSQSSTYIEVFQFKDANTFMSLYDYIINSDFQLPFSDVIARILSVIPYANKIIITEYPLRLSDMFMNEWFRSTYGLGGTFFGETVTMFGILWGPIFSFAFILWLLNKLEDTPQKSLYSKCFSGIFASYTCFFIHRADWVQIVGAFKMVILIYLITQTFNLMLYKRTIILKKKKITL